MDFTDEEKNFSVTLYLESKSYKNGQAKFQQKFIFNKFPPKIVRFTSGLQSLSYRNNCQYQQKSGYNCSKSSAKETTSFKEVHIMGNHVKTWHHWTILV